MLNQIGKATPEELKESNRKCWNSNCNKTAYFDLFGWRWCFKHWRMDYKWGSEMGFWKALKYTKLINRLKNK